MNLISDRFSTASIKYLNLPSPVFGWQRVFASQKGKEVKKVLVDNYPMSILRNAKTKTSGKYAFLKMFCIMFYEFSRAHGWGEGGGQKSF